MLLRVVCMHACRYGLLREGSGVEMGAGTLGTHPTGAIRAGRVMCCEAGGSIVEYVRMRVRVGKSKYVTKTCNNGKGREGKGRNGL